MSDPRPRRYEKVDEHTLRVVVEKSQEVDLATLVKNRKKIQEDVDVLNQRLKDIDEVIAEAKALGISEEVIDVNAQESKRQ